MLRILAAWISTFVCVAAAHGGQTSVEVSMLIPQLRCLKISPAVAIWPTLTPLDLSAGYMDLGEPILLTVFSNSPWELSIRTPVGSPDSLSSDQQRLQWRLEGRPYSDITDEWTLIAAGTGPADGQVLNIQLRLLVDWNSGRPGEYEPRVEYRLAPSGG